MATQAERIEALENNLSKALARIDDLERALRDGETLEELRDLISKAAPLSNFQTLTERVDALDAAQMPRSETQELESRTFNAREELLKLHRKIEAVANHINVKLPA